MKLIELSKGEFAKVDDSDYDELIKLKWHLHISGGGRTRYACHRINNGNGKYSRIFMHRLILGVTDPKTLVDHKDHDGLNNQRNNLRSCEVGQNSRNKRPSKNGTSKYLGVSWHSASKKWIAQIRDIRIGSFKDEVEAAKEYDKKATELFGEFANLNFKNELQGA